MFSNFIWRKHALFSLFRVDKNADGRITAEEVKEVCQKTIELKI
jgi:hypothetical protein